MPRAACPEEKAPFYATEEWLARFGRELLRALARCPRSASRAVIGLHLVLEYGLVCSFDVRLKSARARIDSDPDASLCNDLLPTLRRPHAPSR